MRLVNYRDELGQVRVGALVDGQVIDIAAALESVGSSIDIGQTMRSLIGAGPEALGHIAAALASAAAQNLGVRSPAITLAPLLDPPRIFAIGRNYAEHAKEGGSEVGEFPIVFFKPATGIIGAGEGIAIPRTTERADWEGELAVIIGKSGKYIPEESALEHVVGYTVSNDVSARDWQHRTSQFDSGKMFDTFLPLGPALVTSDEVPDPQALSLTTTVNGVVMQDGTTADMVFSVAHLVSYLSQGVRLLPGDIILTGTPAGVGHARKPAIYLQPGDVVTVEISGVGTLSNPVVAEP